MKISVVAVLSIIMLVMVNMPAQSPQPCPTSEVATKLSSALADVYKDSIIDNRQATRQLLAAEQDLKATKKKLLEDAKQCGK